MDSIAYSIMLEINSNTSTLNKDLNKSLSMVQDYGSQIQNTYSNTNRMVKTNTDLHRGLNKSLNEQSGILAKIGAIAGAAAGEIMRLPVTITKALIAMSENVARATAAATSAAISGLNEYINDASKRYSEFLEGFRTANFQLSGGFSILHDNMTDLMSTMGATFEESKNTIKSMREAGFRASELGENYKVLAKTIYGFERITGVSASTTAKLMKSMTSLGISANKTNKIVQGFASQMQAGNLTTSEMELLIGNLREEMYSLEFAFGTDAVEKYSDALMEFAGAAKFAGVDISKVTGLMSELNRNPLKFVVALGSDALYKSAGENLESLVANLGEMRDTLADVPPGLKPQLLQSIYGIDAATFKALESIEKFRKKFPIITKWGQMWEKANESFGRLYEMMKNKVLAVFEKLGGRFEQSRITLLKFFGGIPSKIQKLTDAVFGFIKRAFDVDVFSTFSKEVSGAVSTATKWIEESISSVTKWLDSYDTKELQKMTNGFIKSLKDIKKWMGEIYDDTIKWFSSVEAGEDGVLKDLKKSVVDVYNSLVEWYKDDGIKKLWDNIKTVGKFIGDYIISPLTWITIKIIKIGWAITKFIWSGLVLVADAVMFAYDALVMIYDIMMTIYKYTLKPIVDVLIWMVTQIVKIGWAITKFIVGSALKLFLGTIRLIYDVFVMINDIMMTIYKYTLEPIIDAFTWIGRTLGLLPDKVSDVEKETMKLKIAADNYNKSLKLSKKMHEDIIGLTKKQAITKYELDIKSLQAQQKLSQSRVDMNKAAMDEQWTSWGPDYAARASKVKSEKMAMDTRSAGILILQEGLNDLKGLNISGDKKITEALLKGNKDRETMKNLAEEAAMARSKHDRMGASSVVGKMMTRIGDRVSTDGGQTGKATMDYFIKSKVDSDKFYFDRDKRLGKIKQDTKFNREARMAEETKKAYEHINNLGKTVTSDIADAGIRMNKTKKENNKAEWSKAKIDSVGGLLKDRDAEMKSMRNFKLFKNMTSPGVERLENFRKFSIEDKERAQSFNVKSARTKSTIIDKVESAGAKADMAATAPTNIQRPIKLDAPELAKANELQEEQNVHLENISKNTTKGPEPFTRNNPNKNEISSVSY